MSPDLTALILEYRYWIILPLSFVEGPVISFAVGTLSSFGYFNPYLAVSIFFFKDIVVDSVFYFLGRYAKGTAFVQRMAGRGKLLGESLEEFRRQWKKNGFRTMFICKLPHGFSSAFLTMMGMIEVPLPLFLIYAAIIAFLQYCVLFVLGYYFGSMLGPSSDLIAQINLLLSGVFIATLAYFIIAWYVRRTLRQRAEKNHHAL